jgi:hypothetical protein
VEWNGEPVSYNELSTILIALYVSEERYTKRGGKGGEYFVSACLSPTIHWVRSHLGKPMALPNPEAPLGDLQD